MLRNPRLHGLHCKPHKQPALQEDEWSTVQKLKPEHPSERVQIRLPGLSSLINRKASLISGMP
jgi:hypothetical protein